MPTPTKHLLFYLPGTVLSALQATPRLTLTLLCLILWVRKGILKNIYFTQTTVTRKQQQQKDIRQIGIKQQNGIHKSYLINSYLNVNTFNTLMKRQGLGRWVKEHDQLYAVYKRHTLYLFYLLERGEGRERNIDVRNINWLPLVRAWTGDRTHNSGMCPDQESNR